MEAISELPWAAPAAGFDSHSRQSEPVFAVICLFVCLLWVPGCLMIEAIYYNFISSASTTLA